MKKIFTLLFRIRNVKNQIKSQKLELIKNTKKVQINSKQILKKLPQKIKNNQIDQKIQGKQFLNLKELQLLEIQYGLNTKKDYNFNNDQFNQDPLLEQKITQQIFLDEIIINSKNKNKQTKQIQPESIDEQINFTLRRQKLIQAMQNNINPKDIKLQVTRQEIMSRKYPQELLQKVKQYQTNDLQYFKQLFEKDTIQGKKLYRRQPKNQFQQFEKDIHSTNKSIIVSTEKNNYEHQKGILQSEDINFYKSKALREFQKKKQPDELKIQTSGKQDLNQANVLAQIFIDKNILNEEFKFNRSEIYKNSTFGKHDKNIKQLNQRLCELGLDFSIDMVNIIGKEILFAEKKLSQEQIIFQKAMMKKQKKKKIKEQLKKIHQKPLKYNLDWQKQISPCSVKNMSQLEMEQAFKQYQQKIKQKKSVLEIHFQSASEIHYKKTFNKIENFIGKYFHNKLFNANSNNMQIIEIVEIIPNIKNTVINIFWNLKEQINDKIINSQKHTQIIKKISIKLNKQKKYISGKLTQVLGLRYGPDIRFHYEVKFKKTQDTVLEIIKHKEQITQCLVQDYKVKGLITDVKSQQKYRNYLKSIVSDNLNEINNRKKMLSKSYRKQLKKIKEQKKITKNSNNDDQTLNKISDKKNTSVDKLWLYIDTL